MQWSWPAGRERLRSTDMAAYGDERKLLMSAAVLSLCCRHMQRSGRSTQCGLLKVDASTGSGVRIERDQFAAPYAVAGHRTDHHLVGHREGHTGLE